MSKLAFTPLEYRHVVFPDLHKGDSLPFNFAQHASVSIPRREPGENLTDEEYQCVQWLFERAGLDLGDYRPETVKRRIPACFRALRVGSLKDVCAAICRQPELLQVAMSALVIGVSSFCRDSSVFDALKEVILPQILVGKPSARIWSAGCSDGAELYSVAILLAEREALQRCELLGTDCRSEAIARAREGSYSQDGIKGVPKEWVGRYVTGDGPVWRVHPFIRHVVRWRIGNVLKVAEPGSWDLILCRNMAIYLHSSAAARLWRQLENSLRPGGMLVLGKAERPFGTTKLQAVAPCIYQRDRS